MNKHPNAHDHVLISSKKLQNDCIPKKFFEISQSHDTDSTYGAYL